MPGYGAPYLGHKVTRPLSVTGYTTSKKKSSKKPSKKPKRSIYKAGYGDRTSKRKEPHSGSRRKPRVPPPPDYEAPRAPSTPPRRKRARDGDIIANQRKTAGDRSYNLYGGVDPYVLDMSDI